MVIKNETFGTTSVLDQENDIGLIRNQLQVLQFFKDDGRVPSQILIEDIEAYRFMLKMPERISVYLKKKEEMSKLGARSTPSDVAKALGWHFL